MIRITFLGTAAARPTVGRNVSGIALQREGDHILFDCGEGTQRQMMRFGTGFSIRSIFFTHLHADHFLGVIGLLRTMGLQGRDEALHLYGPAGAGSVLQAATSLGVDRVQFPVHIHELEPGEAVGYGEYEVTAFAVEHGTSAVGFALKEKPRLGRFDVERARRMGVPEGPLFGRLHRGEDVVVGGKTIRAHEVVGPPRPGRLVVYTGDTRPSRHTVDIGGNADVLIHEATFSEDEAQRARETYHSTALGAAQIAREAGVRRLILTHLSARYADNPVPLLNEAKTIFPQTTVAQDGMSLELGYLQAEGEGTTHG